MTTKSLLLAFLLLGCSAPTPAHHPVGATNNGIDIGGGGDMAKLLQVKEAHLSHDISNSSASYADMTDMSLTITTTTGNYLEITYSVGCIPNSSANGLTGVRAVVASSVADHGTVQFSNTLGGVATSAANDVLVATSAGAHAIKLQWAALSGVANCHGSSVAATEFAQLIVKELVI
jgi:hypothetical protein